MKLYYNDTQLLFCLAPFLVGIILICRTGAWKKSEFWSYAAAYCWFGFDISLSSTSAAFNFLGRIGIGIAALCIINIAVYLVSKRKRGLSLWQLNSLLLCVPLLGHLQGRFGGYLLYY